MDNSVFIFITLVTISTFVFCNGNNHHHHHHVTNHVTTLNSCPPHHSGNTHFLSHGNKCYEFVTNQRQDWNTARSYCHNNKGSLVTIESKQEQHFINTTLHHLGFTGYGVWIGLNDIDNEGTYTWDSGKTTSFRSWAPGQPDDTHYSILTNQDCVLYYVKDVYIHGHQAHGWHDMECEEFINIEEHGWVCEYGTESHHSVPVSTATPQPISTTVAELTEATTNTPESKETTTSPSVFIIGK